MYPDLLLEVLQQNKFFLIFQEMWKRPKSGGTFYLD